MAEVTDTSKTALRVGTSMVCFLFRGVKNVSAKLLQLAIREYLKKSREPKHGEQPISKLIKHGSKLESLEITDQNIKAFERIAKKYGIDFSLEKDRFSLDPIYYVFFKSRDVEIMQHAFKEYSHVKLNSPSRQVEAAPKPSIKESLAECKSKAQQRTVELLKKKSPDIAPRPPRKAPAR